MNATFTKIMMLSTSENDGEALAALRKANSILADAKVTWAELLNATAQTASRPDQSYRTPPSQRRRAEPDWQNVNNDGRRYTDDDVIDPMFTQAFEKNNNPSFDEFLSSIHIWWTKRGFLTEKQFLALKRAAERE